MRNSWWTKGLDGVGGPLVIRNGGLRIQILATAADRTGHPVTEGKINLAVISRIHAGFQTSTCSWWTKGLDGVGGHLVIRSGGLRIQILATAADRTGHPVTEGKIDLTVCPRWSWFPGDGHKLTL